MFDIVFEERTLPELEMKGQPCKLVIYAEAASDFELALDDGIFFFPTTPEKRRRGRA
jgi:hypothetical protein